MWRNPDSIVEVVAAQLCTGCGVCAYIEPSNFLMADTLEYGRRAFQKDLAVGETGEALRVCPGAGLSHPDTLNQYDGLNLELLDAWGPIYGVWEGYAADSEIRHAGSSGGAATALSLFCVEKEGMAGVLHTAARSDVPILNETVMSTSRAELLARTGSRYAPASPADRLDRIENAPTPCVFIGKPCDVAAVQNARKVRPALDEKLGLVISFFCAGVPSIRGNLDLLRANGVEDPLSVKSVRYRGNGWPGMWSVVFVNRDGREECREMTYAESWGFLQRYRQWRCYICPDHTGEFADIAVGDPWYREVEVGEAGKSLIVARSPRGLELIMAAANAGYLVLERESASLLPRSQPNLLNTRSTLWGRLSALRLLGAAVPKYSGFSLFTLWRRNLGAGAKFRSIVGTAKRVLVKKLYKNRKVREWSPRRIL